MKTKITKLLLISFTFILCTLSFILVESCNTTEPIDNKNTPPDTTSQNFTFETYEFGDGYESSYFNDVWIFDENNIWACGYVSTTDSNSRTNIIRWDGKNWRQKGGQFTSSGFEGIWAQDSSNIYFATGAIIKYEDGKFIETDLGNLGFTNGQGVHKLWGSSENNIYGVGPNGTIVHFDGSSWSKIDFDTQWFFYGITGDEGTGIAYAVARKLDFETIIVSLSNENSQIIYSNRKSEYPMDAFVIEMLNENEIYLASNRLIKYNIKTKKETLMTNFESGYGIEIIGAEMNNDIYLFGSNGSEGQQMTHFNGKRFKTFNIAKKSYMIYGGTSVKGNLVVMVSYADGKAYLVKVIRK